nr:uncharacterized mitochondrial protein AtMg00810-like [Tanacetum cinerariifolium]
IVNFIVVVRMFTRSLIIKRRVEDLHHGVESYQKKLNITVPQKTFPRVEFKELYTPSGDPAGIVYEDLDKQSRLMRANELYKFSDGTLQVVRNELPHRIRDFSLGFNKEISLRKWSKAKPTEKHLKEVKRIFRYLWGTVNTGLWYTKDSGFELTGFLDVDYMGCKDTFKSTSGGAQFLGEKLVSWSSKKQDCTTLSTAEAEYVSLSACCAQGELFGISGKLNASQMISQDTLIDFYHIVLWICMEIHQRPTICCFSRSYKAVKVRTLRVILFSIHSDEWKSFQCQHQTALRGSDTLSWKPCQGGSSKIEPTWSQDQSMALQPDSS